MSSPCSPSQSSPDHGKLVLMNGEVGDHLPPSPDSTMTDEPMFSPRILSDLDFTQSKVVLKGIANPLRPSDSLLVRPLTTMDYHRGFTQLLGQLTRIGDISDEMFLRRFHQMKACPSTFYVIVVEDTAQGCVAATGTLVVEQKFIRQCALRGRLEDIVVSDEYRGKQLGKVVVETLRLLGKSLGLYKTSLECTDALVPFYKQFGLEKDEGNNYCLERYGDF